MSTTSLGCTTLPSEKERTEAAESRRQLAAFLSTRFETQQVELIDDSQQRQAVKLPTVALRLLNDILAELELGNTVKVVPIHAELTTQEGADILNVSRPHLVKLLDAGLIPHTKTGRHRRIKFADLMKYKEEREEQSKEALRELASQAQSLGMGYE